MANSNTVSVGDLVDTLIQSNRTFLEQNVDLLQMLQAEMIEASAAGLLEGETEELLRLQLGDASQSASAVFAYQESLQVETSRSFFPTPA